MHLYNLHTPRNHEAVCYSIDQKNLWDFPPRNHCIYAFHMPCDSMRIRDNPGEALYSEAS